MGTNTKPRDLPTPPTYSDVVRPVEGHEDTGKIVEVYDPGAADAIDGWVRVNRPATRQRPQEAAGDDAAAVKPFGRMNHVELDAAAKAAGITFAEDMTVRQKAAVLEGAN